MPNAALLAGLDVGTTNIKAVLLSQEGVVVARAACATPVHYPQPGWAYFEPEAMWQAVVSALRAAIDEAAAQGYDAAQIRSIAVASMAETGYLLDAQGQPLTNAIAWFDSRTAAQADKLSALLGMERIFLSTGIPPNLIYGLPKLLWHKEHEPEAYARAAHWLHTADYIAYRLSGVAATDYSQGSRTMAMDLANLRWDEALIDDAGLQRALFAPLVRAGTALGTVLPARAVETGLPATAMVCAGGHDHLCGALAAGATGARVLLDSIGTSEAVMLMLDKPIRDLRAAAQAYGQGAHIVPGYYGVGAFRTSGVCIEWFRNTLGGGASVDELSAEAADAPAGSLGVRFLPHMRLPHSPSNDIHSRGVFIGLSTDVTRGMMFRAVLEGLAMETRNVLEPLLAYAGYNAPSEIVVIGGGSRSPLFMQIKAAVFNQPIATVALDEAVAIGAALLGGIGTGLYADAATAAATLQAQRTVVQPDAELATLYDHIFRAVYQQIHPALRAVNQANAQLR